MPEDEKQKQEDAWMEDPSTMPVGEFTAFLLDRIFWKKCGPCKGTQTLEIGGVQVTKLLGAHQKSNSGKSGSWSVSFKWMDADGKEHCIDKDSRFAANRRNDADRNWGLGRD